MAMLSIRCSALSSASKASSSGAAWVDRPDLPGPCLDFIDGHGKGEQEHGLSQANSGRHASKARLSLPSLPGAQARL